MNRNAPTDLEIEMYAPAPLKLSGSEEMRFVARLWRAVLRARYWALGAAMVAGLTAYAYSLTLDEQYTAGASVMLDTSVGASAMSPQSFGSTQAALPISPIMLQSEMEVMRSLDLIDAVATELDLYSDPEFAADEAGPVGTAIGTVKAWLRQAVSALVAPDQDGSPTEAPGVDEAHQVILNSIADRVQIVQLGTLAAVYEIQFTSADPQRSADVANALAERYIALQTVDQLALAERSRAWLVARASESRAELDRLNAALEDLIVSSTGGNDQTEALQGLRRVTSDRLRQAQGQIDALDRVLRLEATADLDALQDALRAVSEPSPQLQATLQRLDTVTEAGTPGITADQVRDRVADELRQKRDQAEAIRQELADQESRLAEQARYDTGTRQLENEIEVAENVHANFAELLRLQSDQENVVQPHARIISNARPPIRPSAPQRRNMAILGALLAVLAVTGAAVLKEALSRRLRTVQDYEDATGLPVLGMIPRLGQPGMELEALLGRGRTDVVVQRNARRLRSQIRVAAAARGRPEPRVLIGSSPCPAEGKTASMALLGASYAAVGERVLLIDADFWRSGFWSVLPPSGADYGELIRNPDLVASAAHSVPNTRMDILVAARDLPDQAEFLISDSFRALVEAMCERYDRVLIDAPPILPLADILPLHHVADATVLFVRWNSTPRPVVRSALRALASVQVEPLGCVATCVDASLAHGYSDDEFTHLLSAQRSGY